MALAAPDPPLTDGVLALRLFEDTDAEQITEACQDPALQRYIPVPRPYRLDNARDYIIRTRRQWDEGVKAAFAITRVDDPATVLGAINLATVGLGGNSAYWVHPAARGAGVASSALRLVADWALGDLGLGVVLLEIRPENLPSAAVARAAGFHESGRIDVNTETGKTGGLIFSRLASDSSMI
jgi:RimJ/RimL family protein N-acetyltransferase